MVLRTESVVWSHYNLILNETYCAISGIGLLPFENMFSFGSDFAAYVDVSFYFARAKKNRFIRQVVISTQQSCMCIRRRLIAVCLPLNVSSNKIETPKQFGNNNKMYWKAVVVHKCVLQVLSNPLIVVDFTAQSKSSGNTQINCFKPIMWTEMRRLFVRNMK